ncbi:uncharacterized protein JN550_011251 [Neoarthrinium moseri]|uniref:uncharacterized protein n=1 Tax=Neoarthrinium moseri TaxID=1658444 RepID=UPI001FDB9B49|nr:uncharacterized protein JN550_011251 [Neoarthrinium moseri]KAI1860789.1 hypothetical protein JN550_011251 [Neoarthrinium moseri]
MPIRPTPDPKTDGFKLTFGISEDIAIPFKDTKGLQTVIKSFLRRAEKAPSGENSYEAIEDLSNGINKWRSTVQLATVTNLDFRSDLEHCRLSNEAVFQRTILMSIIDRWRLADMFDYNCEGHWSLQGKHFPLPSTQGPKDKVTGPKPDLAIFFNFESLIGSDPQSNSAPIPLDLKGCLRPDTSFHRCFPFVFIEAKKGFHDLTTALYANMHSASQALLNIHAWMERIGDTDTFFEDVRLFSVAINADTAIVRTHRAKPLDGEGLVYLFDELCVLKDYRRDDICVLIRNILVKYGATTLRQILKDTFDQVSSQYQEELQQDNERLKRKNAVARGAITKKARITQSTGRITSQPPMDPSSSFGASRISLGDD